MDHQQFEQLIQEVTLIRWCAIASTIFFAIALIAVIWRYFGLFDLPFTFRDLLWLVVVVLLIAALWLNQPPSMPVPRDGTSNH